MKTLKLKVKENQKFISNFGSEHSEAIMVVSCVNNNIIAKRLDVLFSVYNSENDKNKQPIDYGFTLSFDEIKSVKTIVNPNTGEVMQWGTPTYTEVLQYFDITENGIELANEQVEAWFLNKVEFQNKKLVEQWENY